MRDELLENEALRVVEESRDTGRHAGFFPELFLGRLDFNLLRSVSQADLPLQNHQSNLFKKVWIEKYKDFLLNEVDPNLNDKTGEIPDVVIEKLRKMGAFGLKIPAEYGGLGFRQTEYREVMEITGSYDGNLAALISPPNSIGASEPLLLKRPDGTAYATEEQRKRFLPQLAAGAISAFALTERGAGSDPSMIKSWAMRVYENGKLVGYRLNGDKLYTTCLIKADGVFLADYVMVVARIFDDPAVTGKKTKLGWGLFIVPTNSPGCIAGIRCHFMGLRAIYNGESHYRDVFVPVENLIGEENEGFKIAQAALVKGRLSVPAIYLGATKQALQQARYWAKHRKQWRRPIGEHELVGEELVDIATKTLVGNALVNYCNKLVDLHQDHRLASAACKILVTDFNLEAVCELFDILGGRGFENYDSQKARGEVPIPAERMLRDSPIARVFEGENKVMKLYLAREGMAEYVNQDALMANPFIILKERANAVLWMLKKLVNSAITYFAIFSHEQFIRRETKILSRHILLAGFWYQILLKCGFQNRQIVVKHLVDRANNLFLMSLALDEAEINKEKPLAKKLADYFCRDAREKVGGGKWWRLGWMLFGRHRKIEALSKWIMAGEAAWLEEGIISNLEKEGVKI